MLVVEVLEYFIGYLAELRISTTARYSRGSSFTPQQATTSAITATGSFEGTTITAPSSAYTMGAIITYQDNAGTNIEHRYSFTVVQQMVVLIIQLLHLLLYLIFLQVLKWLK